MIRVGPIGEVDPRHEFRFQPPALFQVPVPKV